MSEIRRVIEMMNGIISDLDEMKGICRELIQDLQSKCDHPRNQLNVAVGDVHLKTFEASCYECQKSIFFERKRTCVSCYGKMKEVLVVRNYIPKPLEPLKKLKNI